MLDVSQWHDWRKAEDENGKHVWKCRKCKKIYGPYVCEGLKPQSIYLAPCEGEGQPEE